MFTGHIKWVEQEDQYGQQGNLVPYESLERPHKRHRQCDAFIQSEYPILGTITACYTVNLVMEVAGRAIYGDPYLERTGKDLLELELEMDYYPRILVPPGEEDWSLSPDHTVSR